MGFWIFMLIMNLLIPLTMIVFGNIFCYKTPKTINGFYGYRTSMSMKNEDTWEFAHKYCGKLWYKWGRWMMIVTVIAMIALLGKDKDTVSRIGGIICFMQLIPLIGTIIPTEKALRKKFDKNGNKKKGLYHEKKRQRSIRSYKDK